MESWIERDRADARRPITSAEVPALEALGAAVRQRRQEAGLSLRALARLTGLSAGTLVRIEHGSRRTRRSTLFRLAFAIDLGTAGWQRTEWAELAGEALAPESSRSPAQREAARRIVARRRALRPGPPRAIEAPPPATLRTPSWSGARRSWRPTWL